MAGNDSTQLQCIANGTLTDGTHTALVGVAAGAVVTSTGAGVYVITLDSGEPGSGSVTARQCRIFVTPLSTATVTSVIKTTTGGNANSVFTVTLSGDSAMDWAIWKSPTTV